MKQENPSSAAFPIFKTRSKRETWVAGSRFMLSRCGRDFGLVLLNQIVNLYCEFIYLPAPDTITATCSASNKSTAGTPYTFCCPCCCLFCCNSNLLVCVRSRSQFLSIQELRIAIFKGLLQYNYCVNPESLFENCGQQGYAQQLYCGEGVRFGFVVPCRA